MKDAEFAELKSLFFSTKQIIRSQLPEGGDADPNTWLRCEIMQFIKHSKKPTMRDIAAYLRVRASSATSLVNNLSRAGLVRRVESGGDRRVVRVALTSKGEKILDAYGKDSASVMRKVFSRLSEGELKQLIEILRRLRDIHAADASVV